MFVLFCLIVMRMSGAIAFHPVLRVSGLPARFRAALVLMLSLMLYSYVGGRLPMESETLLEFGLLLLRELYIGFCLGFGIELVFLTIRFATSIMDFSMGLNMAQVFDPSTNTQSTVTSGLFYSLLILLFFATDGHLHFLRLLFETAETIPLGTASLHIERVPGYMLEIFRSAVLAGLQIAFPIMGIELMTEVSLGILMRVIPQINIFVVNFQTKILVGLMMLFFLLNPLTDRMNRVLEQMNTVLRELLQLLR